MGQFLQVMSLLGAKCYSWTPRESPGLRAFPACQHSKVLITEVGVISGSKNLSRNSLAYHDAGYVTANPRLVQQYRNDFERQRANSRLVDLGFLGTWAYPLLRTPPGVAPQAYGGAVDLQERNLYIEKRFKGLRGKRDYWAVLNPW